MPGVLHIGKFFPPFAGGIENLMADLMSAQAKAGLEVHAIAHDHQSPGWNLWPAFEPDETYLNLYRAPCYGRLLYAPVSPHFPFWLSRVIARLQPDVLHFHLPNTSAFWALMSPAARRLPWVLHWHSDVVADVDKRLGPAYQVYRPFEHAMLKHARRIIATSPPYLEHSPTLKPWRDKCDVIPLGIDTERLPAATPDALAQVEGLWGDAECKLLSVGRLTYYKGYKTLLQAMTSVDNARLLIVGEGEQRSELERMIAELDLTEKVRLLGYCDASILIALMQSCDCFCLASLERTEAFGVVLMEAMRYGRPVVASGVQDSGMSWVVEPGKTGLSPPPGDVNALADALRTIAQQPELRKSMGEAGQQRFESLFLIERVAERVNALYQTL